MRKRNKCGLFLSLCMAVAWTTQAQTSADGYVIAVEGDDVYIDLAEGKIAKGDILEVCSKPGYFVHPVTKKRIRKESKRISSLIVKDVFGDYSTAKSVPSQTLESIQVGMPLKRIEMAVDSSANVGHIVAIDGTDVYIDLTEEEIWPNSKLEVYSKDSYFVHPVTGTHILREGEQVASLEVVEAGSDYTRTRLSEPSLSPLEAGMAVKQGLAVMSESPTEEPVQMALPTQSMEAATAGNNSSNSFSGTDSNILSGEEIQAKGLSLYRGAQKLTKEEIKAIRIVPLYDIYSKVRKQNAWAWVAIGFGSVAVCSGVISLSTESASGAIAIPTIIGAGAVVGGAILVSHARKQMKNAAALYNNMRSGRMQQTTSYELSMVVPETGGLGLRLSF